MRETERFVVAVLWVIIGALASVGAVAGQDVVLERKVDEVFAAVDTPDSAGCAVSVMRRGAIVYERGYGMANLEYGIPITPSSVFHVASVSKQFTALAVALLAAEGKVSWDDDIRKYVPELPDHGVTITLEDLVHHISGLRDQWSLLSMAGWRWEADVVKQEDVLDIISRQKALNFEPRAEYLYSNTGFTLLAVVVERVSGQSLREFTTERIFEPLGMNDTHFHDDHQIIVRNRAYAYEPDSVFGMKISIPDFDVVGASSLFTTVRDMARWDRNFYTGQVGGPEVLALMHKRGVLSSGDTIPYAFGLSHGMYRGLRTVGHAGADAGYRSQLVRFPDQEFSVAVFCNYPHSAPWEKANRIAELYLAGVLTEPVGNEDEAEDAVVVPEAEMREVEGYYVSPHTDFPQYVRLRAGRLHVGGSDIRALVALGDRRFRLEKTDLIVRFERAGGGGMKLYIPSGSGERVYARAAPADTTAAARQELVGAYYSEELGAAYRVELEDDALYLWNRKHGRMPLSPTHRDGFTLTSLAISFTRDELGRVSGFTMSSGRVRRLRFERVE